MYQQIDNSMKTIVLLALLSFGSSGLFATPDSVGTVHKDGFDYVIHMVEDQETLYKIGQRYAVEVEVISEANRLTNNTIFPGQVLRIPLADVTIAQTPVKVSVPLSSINTDKAVGQEKIPLRKVEPKIIPKPSFTTNNHEVAPGQTLYSISRMYPNVSPQNIRDWNALTSDTILIGQQLTLRSAIQTGQGEPMGVSNLGAVKKEAKPVLIFNTADAAESEKPVLKSKSIPRDVAPAEVSNKFLTLKEKGSATFIQTPSRKPHHEVFALHQSAPVGSWITVTNLVNGKSIKARVIGRFTQGIDDAIVVKLSSNGVNGLAAGDPKLMVEVRYLGE